MFQSVSAVKTSADLAYLQRSHKIDRNPVAIISEPGVKAAFTVKGLALRHLEAEFMAPDSSLPWNLLILDSEVAEIYVPDMMVDGVSHRIPSPGAQFREIHVADEE